MIDSNRWVLAVILLAACLLVGEIAGRLARASMARADRTPEIREMARPVQRFLFWVSFAAGLVLAVASTSAAAFDDVPDRVLRVLPNLVLAGLICICGYAVSIVVSAAVTRTTTRTAGTRNRRVERWSRVAVGVGTAVLALSQLGVDTTLLSIALGILAGAPALAVALLTAFGGRRVATEIAAGRALRSHLKVGYGLRCGDVDGRIVAIHPVSVEVETADGALVHLPFHRLLDEPFSTSPARARA